MRCYIAIDLKSFYASVECVERGLNALTTNLVVADESRTEKTICLAVSPSLKEYGVGGRARLFEVVERVKEVNAERRRNAPRRTLGESCYDAVKLKEDPSLALGYLIATPRMGLYIEYSKRVYSVYLRYVAPEDIHVYSIDEVFMDVTSYMKAYGCTPRELAEKILRDVFSETGVTATAGIGTNLYLSKVAMDIVAKHLPADENGVRIAELDEAKYRGLLWSHRPLTDFWRVGRGYARKLEQHGIRTMGDVARCSLYNEDLLYELFGVNAELLIDHAWGWEPCTIADIKAYHPRENSVGSGQVLGHAYSAGMGRLVLREMVEGLALDLVEKGLETNQLVLNVGYDTDCLKIPAIANNYRGEIVEDRYGRSEPKPAHGAANLERYTSSAKKLAEAALSLYDRIVLQDFLVRRLDITACRVLSREEVPAERPLQLDLFTDYAEEEKRRAEEDLALGRERSVQETVISIQKKFGKNALLKGMDLEEGATARDRNGQIGGHKK